jgi:hypothetical protein
MIQSDLWFSMHIHSQPNAFFAEVYFIYRERERDLKASAVGRATSKDAAKL